MKTALITTTINVPHVLALYRKIAGPEVHFFIATEKVWPVGLADFVARIGNCTLTHGLAYKCSELIGWCNVQRRNVALLDAIKWGADVIVTIDDDNIPLHPNKQNYFEDIEPGGLFNGLCVDTRLSWFDPGQLLLPPASHRGFPHNIKSQVGFSHVVDAKVGVAAGMCLGDPDVGAATRIAAAPVVHGVSEVLRAGVVVDPRKHWTVFNSQATAFVRDIAPAMLMVAGAKRYDDIYASLICQRVMREKNLHVHFGQPFVHQQRNQHDLVTDLRGEIDGMEHVLDLAGCLDAMYFPAGVCVLDMVHEIYSTLQREEWFPKQGAEAGLAWVEDCRQVLAC